MKPKRLTIISLTLLTTLLLGAAAILALSQKPVGANVAWKPKYYTWDSPPPTPPDPWNAEVWLKGGHKAQTEINETTILLEGLYSPSAPTYPKAHGPRLIIPFNGMEVRAALEPKLPSHMGIPIPGKYRIPLEITGQLYTGETFQGSGVIVVTVSPPPPP